MHDTLKIGMIAAALVVVGTGAAEARLTAANRTGQSVWLTLYNSFGQQLDSTCVTDTADKVWAGGSSPLSAKVGSPGEMVYIRGELKEKTNCGGKTLSDTGRGGTIMVGKDTVKTFSVIGGKIRVS